MGRTDRLNRGVGRPCLAAAAPNPRRHIAHLRVGFAPQREGVGMLARDLDRGIGATADEGIDASGLIAA